LKGGIEAKILDEGLKAAKKRTWKSFRKNKNGKKQE
jgi:hypothetical protein